MSVSNPAHLIPRQKLSGHDPYYVKSIDPPTASPDTPELLAPTNPVPEFMQSLGIATVEVPHTVQPDLMHSEALITWDGKRLDAFLFQDMNTTAPASFPGPIYRVPRGVIFHAKTHGHGPPPHTIHWHGIEPTPINDGVGHCSMEVGGYTYQWQPNFIGTYFYHCHRNTVQHFEYGLYSGLFIETPDAFDTGPGKNPGGYPRRTAAFTKHFPEFPGFVEKPLESGDPHAMTVPYDVEAFWTLDDLDSVWMEKMSNPRTAIATAGTRPGRNDIFTRADFHDYNPNYFTVTGKFFPGKVRTSAAIRSGLTIPRTLNSGVEGMQISVNAKIGQTILIRILCAAYSEVKIKLPVDGLIIAYDGRALGVPPFGSYSEPIPLPAGKILELTTARRADVLIRTTQAIKSFAEVEYINHQDESLLFTGKIPIVVSEK